MAPDLSIPEPKTETTRLPLAAWLLSGAVLIIYLVLLVVMLPDHLEGDEIRYHDDVLRMQNAGFVDAANPRVYNGPGLPLFLYPFVVGGAPDWVMRLHAPLAVAVAALFLFLTARQYMSQRWALVFAGFCSFHPSLMHQGWHIMPEPLAQLFMAVFLWCVTRAMHTGLWWSRWHLGAMLAYFTLTMVRTVWGPVMMVSIVLCVLLMLLRALRRPAGSLLIILAGAMLLSVPYLQYTYAKTGRPLLWTSLSGELAYWMTSYEGGENGYWYADDVIVHNPVLNDRHGPFLHEVYQKKQLECNDLMMQEAVRRAKANPTAMLFNYVCNVCRLFFGFPCSLEHERISALVLLGSNGVLLAGLAAGFILALFQRQGLPFSLLLLLMPAVVYLGGTSVLSTQPRYLLGVVPILTLVALALLARVPWARLLEKSSTPAQEALTSTS